MVIQLPYWSKSDYQKPVPFQMVCLHLVIIDNFWSWMSHNSIPKLWSAINSFNNQSTMKNAVPEGVFLSLAHKSSRQISYFQIFPSFYQMSCYGSMVFKRNSKWYPLPEPPPLYLENIRSEGLNVCPSHPLEQNILYTLPPLFE